MKCKICLNNFEKTKLASDDESVNIIHPICYHCHSNTVIGLSFVWLKSTKKLLHRIYMQSHYTRDYKIEFKRRQDNEHPAA